VRNGIPFVSEVPTIIFGADVTHPPPGEDSASSIAAVSLFPYLTISQFLAKSSWNSSIFSSFYFVDFM
jgi:hypothetical protein